MNRQALKHTAWLLIFCMSGCFAQNKNGFDLDGVLIPVNQIVSGEPAKDGIPAIDNPRFVTADNVDFLSMDSPVLGVHHKGIVKAYPVNILNWHEIVNDQFNNDPVVITFLSIMWQWHGFFCLYRG